MGDDESTPKISNENLERTVVERVGQVISSIDEATHADQVIAALCSLAVQLFPVDPLSISGIVEEKHRDELLNLEVPEKDERLRWWNSFYKGSAFRAFARVLLYDIASSWLACFPTSARRHVYDVFFLEGPTTEVIQEAVPCLRVIGNGEQDVNAVCSNAERLLVLCLLENDGVLQIMLEFAGDSELSHEQLKQVVSRISQIITSIPDKARRVAPASFSPHLFFKKITSQILRAAEERYLKLTKGSAFSADSNIDGSILFAGDVFARISRRGSIAMHPEASVLASPFLDMLRSRAISHHPEAYVRRSALFAASCVVLSLHPSFVASAITEHNTDICEGLEWIRSWALQVSDSDTDRECHTLAMGCLQLHAEMVMQASRVLESSKDVLDSANNINLISSVSSKRSIKIPYLN